MNESLFNQRLRCHGLFASLIAVAAITMIGCGGGGGGGGGTATNDGKAKGGVAAPATAASGKKLAAFRSVVSGWERYMGARGGSEEVFLKWFAEIEEQQKAFFAVPFDPSTDRDEAKAIYDLYKERLTTIGELMKTLNAVGGTETAVEQAVWRRLTAHLTPIFKAVAENP